MNDSWRAHLDSVLNEQNKDHNKSEQNLNADPNQNIGINEINAEAEKLIKNGSEENNSRNLKKVLATQEKLKELVAKEIPIPKPVLTHGEKGIFYAHTMNVVQGQAGVHKSRLAEVFCAAFLKQLTCSNPLLGFKRTSNIKDHTVVYVDTERNLVEQLPYALQSIQIKAGFSKEDIPDNFQYISLLEIKRNVRFDVLNEYLGYLRKRTANPLFIVLDVSTDCIEDFNKSDKSMELIDLMNIAINEHNVIFLCLIHENPRSDKARGHFGTELMNKSSTVMQVGFEKNSNGEDTEIIRIKFLKCRSDLKYEPLHLKYCKTTRGLVLANAEEVSDVINKRKHKATNEDMIDHIEMYLGDGTVLSRNDLLDKLCADFKASVRTIEGRLKELIEAKIEIIDKNGKICKLSKEKKDKNIFYWLDSKDEI